MVDQVKVIIAERNGQDLDYHEEIALTASNIPVSSPSFTSDNVLEALVEAKEASSGDIHSGQYLVDNGETVTINEKKQMRIFQTLINSGSIIIEGWLTVEQSF